MIKSFVKLYLSCVDPHTSISDKEVFVKLWSPGKSQRTLHLTQRFCYAFISSLKPFRSVISLRQISPIPASFVLVPESQDMLKWQQSSFFGIFYKEMF